jgi:hypothetical protein
MSCPGCCAPAAARRRRDHRSQSRPALQPGTGRKAGAASAVRRPDRRRRAWAARRCWPGARRPCEVSGSRPATRPPARRRPPSWRATPRPLSWPPAPTACRTGSRAPSPVTTGPPAAPPARTYAARGARSRPPTGPPPAGARVARCSTSKCLSSPVSRRTRQMAGPGERSTGCWPGGSLRPAGGHGPRAGAVDEGQAGQVKDQAVRLARHGPREALGEQGGRQQIKVTPQDHDRDRMPRLAPCTCGCPSRRWWRASHRARVAGPGSPGPGQGRAGRCPAPGPRRPPPPRP